MRYHFAHLLLVPALYLCGWIDYDDAVRPQDAAFGNAFQGISLRLSTEEVDVEQGSSQPLRISLRNDSQRSTLVEAGQDERTHTLCVILATEDGTAFVSQNLLLEQPDNPITRQRLPPGATVDIVTMSFDDLMMAAFSEYVDGMPHVNRDAKRVPAEALVPRIYLVKAVLFSAVSAGRPDFAVASETWTILLRPKPGERMTAEERDRKMHAWLARMSEGAYGGMGVSSQLAALGEVAVPELIAMAEKRAPDERDDAAGRAVRESRIWAIVTLCNSGSRTAEDYILEKLRDPVSFGDLAYLLWHSQGFDSPRVQVALRAFAEDAACGRPMPWESDHGHESHRHAVAALEFLFKHFIQAGLSVSDATIRGVIDIGNPKVTAFGLTAWSPDSAAAALDALRPLFTGGRTHGNVKKAVLRKLSEAGVGADFPRYDRAGDVKRQWLQACLWLENHSMLRDNALRDSLRWLVLDVARQDTALQSALIEALRTHAGEEIPPIETPASLPEDWVAIWRWALRSSDIDSNDAIAYCTGQMRTREDLHAVVKRGLLLELRRIIGTDFPLDPAEPADTSEDWARCGRWLVANGYFDQGDR